MILLSQAEKLHRNRNVFSKTAVEGIQLSLGNGIYSKGQTDLLNLIKRLRKNLHIVGAFRAQGMVVSGKGELMIVCSEARGEARISSRGEQSERETLQSRHCGY